MYGIWDDDQNIHTKIITNHEHAAGYDTWHPPPLPEYIYIYIYDMSLYDESVGQDLDLDGGGEGYPLTPAHTDLRDTEITESTEANLVDFDRLESPVDLSRSVW